MSAKEDLRRRFSELRMTTEVKRTRGDFKGERRKMTVRVPELLLDKLRLLRLAGHVETNAFCVTVLEQAVDDKLAQVKASHSQDSWDVLVRCADAGKDAVQVD